MDWYAWLSKAAGLSPALTYEYAALLSENELEPYDAPHFDHDLLQSMGIAVAKHRLEILKLARKPPSSIDPSNSSSYARLEGLARKAGRCLARCARRISGAGGGRGLSSSAAASVSVAVAVPRICNGGDGDVVVRAGAVRRRQRKVGKMVLMITDGGGCGGGGERDGGTVRFEAAAGRKASLMFHDCGYEDEEEDEEERLGDDEDAAGGMEIKWDSMFQDLKPT